MNQMASQSWATMKALAGTTLKTPGLDTDSIMNYMTKNNFSCTINKRTYSSFEHSKFNRAAFTGHCSTSLLFCSKRATSAETCTHKILNTQDKKIKLCNML
jgi:hypothetical protein